MNPICPPPKTAKPTEPIDLEKLGPAILKLQEAIASTRRIAKDKLIVLLLHDMTGLSKRDIQMILDAIPEIAKTYLQPVKEK